MLKTRNRNGLLAIEESLTLEHVQEATRRVVQQPEKLFLHAGQFSATEWEEGGITYHQPTMMEMVPPEPSLDDIFMRLYADAVNKRLRIR